MSTLSSAIGGGWEKVTEEVTFCNKMKELGGLPRNIFFTAGMGGEVWRNLLP